MNKFIRILIIALIAISGTLEICADSPMTSQTLFRIEKLSTPTIKIGNKTCRQGDTFKAGEEIKWTAAKQSMLVKNMTTHDVMRFSKRISEKKGKLKSILDLYVHSNKGSSRGLNNQISVDKSSNSGNFPDKRIALIIGNQNYETAPLRNPQKDAEDIADELSELGFDVIELYETDYSDLMAGINKFAGLANNYDVALFYFAGHGIQNDGINYLVPVDNRLEDRARDLRFCVSCNHVVDKVEDSGCKSRIFFFDACRENYTGWSRSVANGLSKMEGAPGTVIVFATESGNVAMDGGWDGNSPFASSLIKNLKQPSKSFSDMMDGVVRDTYSATNSSQYPVRVGTLMTDFRFNNPKIIPRPGNSGAVTTGTNGTSSLSAEELCKKGDNYYYGRGVTQNYQEAAKWYRLAADKGHAAAQNGLGYMYLNGYGVAKDYAEAMKWCREAAEQGNTNAQNNLGYMYHYGYGVTQDYAEAVKWYRKAAEHGNAAGQNSLGYMFQNGYGVTKDYSEALKWYRRAAEQGNASGQFDLGYMYENGYGVTKDAAEAMKWYKKAADQGNENAKKALFRLNGTADANTISGTVYDEDGEPLIGCTVSYEDNGIAKGTATDLDGNWKLDNVKPGTVLQFSYVGCKTKKIKVTAGSDFSKITMYYK